MPNPIGMPAHDQRGEDEALFSALRSQLEAETPPHMREGVVMSMPPADGQATSMPSADSEADPYIDLTKDELYRMAKEEGVENRSKMTKRELISALRQR